MSRLTDRIFAWARALKRDIVALHIAAANPRTPRAAKLFAFVVLAYALSPIDLIPDFIPVLGQVDDVILVPVGVWLAVRMIPPDVLAEARARAQAMGRLPKKIGGALIICALWAIGLAALVYWLWN